MSMKRWAAPPNDSDTLEYYDYPLKLHCEACDTQVISKVKCKTNWATYVAFFLLLMFGGLIGLCAFPFVRLYTRDAVHKCPKCKSELARYRRFQMPNVGKDIITLKCGNCAVVLSKAYFIGFSLIATLILTLGLTKTYLRSFRLPEIEPGPPIAQTWQDFVADCGASSYLGNPIRTSRNFDEIYFGKSVIRWEGRVNKVRLGLFHRNFIFFTMPALERRISQEPDLSLMYNADTLDEKVAGIEVGDLVAFNATLLELGTRPSRPTLGLLNDMEKLQSTKELPPLFEEDALMWLKKPPVAQVSKVLKDLRRNIADKSDGGLAFYVGGDDAIFVGRQAGAQTEFSPQ